jgi:hypothetical protein
VSTLAVGTKAVHRSRSRRPRRAIYRPRPAALPWATLAAVAFGAGATTIASLASAWLGLVVALFVAMSAGIGGLFVLMIQRRRFEMMTHVDETPSDDHFECATPAPLGERHPTHRPTLKSAKDDRPPRRAR